MSTSRRTRRFCRNAGRRWRSGRWLAALLVSAPSGAVPVLFMAESSEAVFPPPVLTCAWRVPPAAAPGQPVALTLRLRNPGPAAVSVLTWGTPFEEAWLQPFLEVQRDGQPVPYGGASVKRGDPTADEYLRLAPRQSRTARLDLTEVFDLTVPGRYTVTPRLVVHDVATAPTRVPRPRAAHQPQSPACGPVSFVITPSPAVR